MDITSEQVRLAKLCDEAFQKRCEKIKLIPPSYEARCVCCDKVLHIHNSLDKQESLGIMYESNWTWTTFGWRCDLCTQSECVPYAIFKIVPECKRNTVSKP